MNCIDYGLIADATGIYEGLGYKRIEAPWWVTADIANITKPTGVPESNNYKLSVNGKCLVASGEQSFLYLANKGFLPPGKYQTVTPCFRNEAYDAYHSKQFIKLELIELIAEGAYAPQDAVVKVARHALSFFKRQAGSLATNLRLIPTGVKDPIACAKTEQLDIVFELDGQQVELGSYGARETTFAVWVYGTGIAEPRFSRSVRQFMGAV